MATYFSILFFFFPFIFMVHWEDPEGLGGQEVGGAIRIGNTCKSMADSCQCMAKTTSVFLPAKSYGQRSLADYSPWGLKRVRQI